jgi:membrane fusion protein, multidrug efflux system
MQVADRSASAVEIHAQMWAGFRPAPLARHLDVVLKPLSRPELGEIRIDDAVFAIGRTEQPFASYGNDIINLLSRRHARIFRKDGFVYLADLESRNGTTVNRVAIGRAPSKLRDGDEICFGDALSYRVQITPRTRPEGSLTLTLTPKSGASRLLPDSARRRWWRVPAVAGVLSALALTAHFFWSASERDHWFVYGRFVESTDDAYVGGDITVIAPKVAGFIVQVAVTDNEPVHAGDLLVKLDARDYRAALARADAAVSGQQATLANLDAKRHLQQALIAQARAEIAASDAEIVRARGGETRFRQLSARAAASVEVYEKAKADYDKALAAGQKAHAILEAAERELDVIDTEKRQTDAGLAAALAERETAGLNVGYTELRAPIDGTIGNRSARLGAYATVGAQLLSIVPARGLWVDANFKESQLARMRPGQPATIVADVLPGQVFRGRVASLAPATGAQFSVLPAENATGNFTKIVQRVPVRILLEGEAAALGRLRPGLSVTADVDERSTAPRAVR